MVVLLATSMMEAFVGLFAAEMSLTHLHQVRLQAVELTACLRVISCLRMEAPRLRMVVGTSMEMVEQHPKLPSICLVAMLSLMLMFQM